MPWTIGDVDKFTDAATTDALKRQWVEVANSVLARCLEDGGDADECDAAAIRQANDAIRQAVEEAGPSEQDTFTPPEAAQNNAKKVLRWREEHGDDVKGMTRVGWTRARQLASGEPISLETVRRMAQFNRHRQNAAVAPEYESEPWKDAGYVAWLGWGGTTGINWAIDVSQSNQEASMDYRELAIQAVETARACVLENAFFVALAEEKGITPQRLAESLLDAIETQLSKRERAGAPEHSGTEDAPWGDEFGDEEAEMDYDKLLGMIDGAMEQLGAVRAALSMGDEEPMGGEEPMADEEMPPMADEEGADEETEASELAELNVPVVTLTEQVAPADRRAPLEMAVGLIRVGPGNKRDNHYYTREMLERDGKAFEGLTMHVVDHREEDRAETTDVSTVKEVLGVRELADGEYLVARVVAYDPQFCEKTRNRALAGELDKLQCSILARGEASPGEIDGEKYNIVQAITEGRFVDWVTRAGAGGKALELSELDAEPEEAEGEDFDDVVEIDIEEADDEPAALEASAVLDRLGETSLPAQSVSKLALGEYASADELKEAIEQEITRLKEAGSGRPFAQPKQQQPHRRPTREEIAEAQASVNKRWLKTK